MDRRTFLNTSALAAAALMTQTRNTTAGPLQGKIRKSLKWNMVGDRSLPLADAFHKLRECGYEGIEPNLSEVEDPEAWLQASRKSGLVIDAIVGPQIDNIEAAIDLSKELGGDSILVVCRYDQKRPFWDSYRTTQDAIRAAAPHAERQQIKILVENVWATFLISPLDMHRYIDEINHPWVGVHYDVGNVMRWGVAEHWVQVLGPQIQKLDIKEYDLNKAMKEGMARGFQTPIGEGSINWAGVREELTQLGYSGWAAAEVQSGDWDYLADVSRRMDQVLGLT